MCVSALTEILVNVNILLTLHRQPTMPILPPKPYIFNNNVCARFINNFKQYIYEIERKTI